MNDVLIDGVTAHDSHVSEGIFVSAGGAWIETNGVSQPLGSNVTVQNSTAHDIYGDGILITELNNGLLQRNVVYRSGLCPNCTGSTPVGLWEWYCHTCTVQNNESYANQSWGGDGGDFDIDYYNNNNVVQYNYGHDSAGYCVAFFGAGGRASLDNVFRYNVCSNNGRRSDLSKQGEVFVYTWDQWFAERSADLQQYVLLESGFQCGRIKQQRLRPIQAATHAFSRTTLSMPRSRE